MDQLKALFDLTGKTALVTGASSGLGVTMAQTLAAAGANVVVAARRIDKLKAVAESMKALALPCDVGDPAQVKTMFDAAVERFGHVDILVNNAGVCADAGIMPEKLPPDLFEQTIRINLVGLWFCTREAGERMLRDRRGGSIINIASILGIGGTSSGPPAYHAAKAAVINLTRTLACTWGDRGVRVNAIAPGWFPSEMTEDYFSLPGMVDRLKQQTPMGRLGSPSELAGPLLFLASQASSFVNGHTLVVDGGFTASIGNLPYTQELYDLFAKVIPKGLGERIMPEG